jgi:hypothetical protein
MKNLKSILAVLAVVALFASSACTRRYTCPTYLKEDVKPAQKDLRC